MDTSDISLIDGSWTSPRMVRPGERCLKAAFQSIKKLGPPFLVEHEGPGLISIMSPWPCFSFDPQFIEKAKRVAPHNEETHEQWETKWGEVAKRLTPLPKRARTTAWRILWRCDATTRRHVASTNLIIEEFLGLFDLEELRLSSLRQITSVVEAANRQSLFQFNHTAAIEGHGRALTRFCGLAQEQINQARSLVEKAEIQLSPAKRFYLGEHVPRFVKQALCDLLMTPAQDKKAAASLFADLLSWADPRRPVSAEAIRQIYYGR